MRSRQPRAMPVGGVLGEFLDVAGAVAGLVSVAVTNQFEAGVLCTAWKQAVECDRMPRLVDGGDLLIQGYPSSPGAPITIQSINRLLNRLRTGGRTAG